MNKVEKLGFVIVWILIAIFVIPFFIPLVNVGSLGFIWVIVLLIVTVTVPIMAIYSKDEGG
jgi:hypothetical protein